ncbi:MAG: M48 family metallopeptidase [Pseudomonadota bacterium]
MSAADFFDGENGAAQRADVTLETDHLRVERSDILRWPLAELHAVGDAADPGCLAVGPVGEATRVVIRDPELLASLRRACPALETPERGPGWRRLLVLAVAAGATVWVSVALIQPALTTWLAASLTPEAEALLGDVSLRNQLADLGEDDGTPVRVCSTPEADAALTKLADRILVGVDIRYDLQFTVVDYGGLNAISMPGGRILIMDGIFQAAETAEELASVVAHELGHSYHRHATTRALREAAAQGLPELLIGNFPGGDKVIEIIRRLTQARYKRSIEIQADGFAHDRMRDAGIPVSAMASLFLKMSLFEREQRGLASHLQTHPSFADRIAAAEAADAGGASGSDLLSDAEWTALRTVCDG